MNPYKPLTTMESKIERYSLRYAKNVIGLNQHVDTLRKRLGLPWLVPYFDPFDAGTEAKVLFLLEAPGPQSVLSGFISLDNPDKTAPLWQRLVQEAKLKRSDFAMWNCHPSYITTSTGSIRAPKPREIRQHWPHLHKLLAKFNPHTLRAICLVGRKAQILEPDLAGRYEIFTCLHPSTRHTAGPDQRLKENEMLEVLEKIKSFLGRDRS